MTHQVGTPVLRCIIDARRLAMSGNSNRALELLERFIKDAGDSDQEHAVALLTVKAEILAHSFRENEALDLFRSEIDPRLECCSTETAFIVTDNRIALAARILDFEEYRDHDEEVDARRLADFDLWDAKRIAIAQEHADNGDHLDAITLLWRELRRVTRNNCWRATEIVARQLATHWLGAQRPLPAIICAIMALDVDLGKQVAKNVAETGTTHVVVEAVQKIIAAANLPAHARIGAVILGSLADYIPEEQVPGVIAWLMGQCGRTATTRTAADAVVTAWDAIGHLSFRLEGAVAERVFAELIVHPLWTLATPGRKTLVNVANALMPRLPTSRLDDAITALLPLARELRHDADYSNVLSALRHAVRLADPSAKDRIRENLFPSGHKADVQQTAAAADFGGKLDASSLHSLATIVAADVKNQIQRGVPGEPDSPLRTGSFGTIGTHSPEGGVRVHIFGGANGLDAVVAHRSSMLPTDIAAVARACIAMIATPDNLIQNKVMLAQIISQLTDVMTGEIAQEAHEALLPLAQGAIVEASLWPKRAVMDDALNPFKIDMGDPSELQGAALHAIVDLAHFHNLEDTNTAQLVLACAAHPAKEVRRLAMAAIAKLKSAPEGTIATLLMGTRDEDITVARFAFSALATCNTLTWRDVQWHTFIHAATRSAQSVDAKLREASAACISRLLAVAPTDIATKLTAVLDSLRSDVSFVVRSAALATSKDSDENGASL